MAPSLRRLLPFLFLLSTAHAAPAPLVGAASVIDGDTLEIRGVRVRLFGIDAPESSQTCTKAVMVYRCGQRAALAQGGLVKGKTVTCTPKSKDRYGRTVALCSVGKVNVNAWMVGQGHALAYLQYGGAMFASQEKAAKAARLGMHARTCTAPWAYRVEKNTVTPGAAPLHGQRGRRRCSVGRRGIA